MRLAIINQFYPPDISPTAHLCASLGEYRAEQGDDVTMIAGRGGYLGPLASGTLMGKVRLLRVWSTRFGNRSRLTRLIDWATFYVSALIHSALLRRQDVIISLTTPPYIALAALLHRLLHPRTRVVLWNMDCYPEAVERTGMTREGSWISRTMRWLNRVIYRRLDHLVCLDKAMAELLSQYKPVDHALATSIIPNWERAALFPAHGAHDPKAPFMVLYLGNAGYGHEFDTFIAAAEKLKNDPVTFLFVGGGARIPWIAKRVKQLGLTNVIFRDYVPKEQTPALMEDPSCALITLETQMAGVMSPSKLHANLAMGLPIVYVGPPHTNVDEAINRFACGIAIRPGDAEGMATFIRELMGDTQRLAAFRAAARSAFDRAYCDRQALPQFDAILDSMQSDPAQRNA